MSDLMLHGVLNMPIDIWGDDPLDKVQRHSRYVEASRLIARQQEDLEDFKSALVKAEKELTTLRQYKAEVESQEPDSIWQQALLNAVIDVIRADKNNSGNEPSISVLGRSIHELQLIINDADIPRPAPAGSCAMPDIKQIISETRSNNGFTNDALGCAMSHGFEKALDLLEAKLNYHPSMLSAIPSNSEGEK